MKNKTYISSFLTSDDYKNCDTTNENMKVVET